MYKQSNALWRNRLNHDPIQHALDATRTRIREYEQRYARNPGSVQLIAVSKTHPADRIHSAVACGQRNFGENYLQDALPKIERLRGLNLCWHFIGHIQSNKCRDIAANFDWVHSVERLKIARLLDRQRGEDLGPLNIFIQVNLDDERNKSGVAPSAVPELASAIANLPHLRLRGLMAIPRPEADFQRQRAAFSSMRELLERVQQQGIDAHDLSMGMSADMEAAIAEGATHVRIGTAIFGSRKIQPAP